MLICVCLLGLVLTSLPQLTSAVSDWFNPKRAPFCSDSDSDLPECAACPERGTCADGKLEDCKNGYVPFPPLAEGRDRPIGKGMCRQNWGPYLLETAMAHLSYLLGAILLVTLLVTQRWYAWCRAADQLVVDALLDEAVVLISDTKEGLPKVGSMRHIRLIYRFRGD